MIFCNTTNTNTATNYYVRYRNPRWILLRSSWKLSACTILLRLQGRCVYRKITNEWMNERLFLASKRTNERNRPHESNAMHPFVSECDDKCIEDCVCIVLRCVVLCLCLPRRVGSIDGARLHGGLLTTRRGWCVCSNRQQGGVGWLVGSSVLLAWFH